jgi:hypothetical protein
MSAADAVRLAIELARRCDDRSCHTTHTDDEHAETPHECPPSANPDTAERPPGRAGRAPAPTRHHPGPPGALVVSRVGGHRSPKASKSPRQPSQIDAERQ